ncbi:MAG TPA: hypothetical protein VGB82_23295 [Alphaproteobacteria bacterium]
MGRSNSAASVTRTADIQTAPAESQTQTAPAELQTQTAEEMLVENVRRFREAMRLARTQMISEEEAALASAKEKIARATKFARDTGVDGALCAILKGLWHYPSWAKRDDAQNHVWTDLTDISGGDERKGSDELKTINFAYNGQRYTLLFEHGYYYDHSAHGRITFKAGDETVFSMSVLPTSDSADYDQWRPWEIDLLKIGPWIGPVVEIEEKLKARLEKWFRDLQADRLRKQAEGLP